MNGETNSACGGQETSGINDQQALQPDAEERWRYEADAHGAVELSTTLSDISIEAGEVGAIETFPVTRRGVPVTVFVGEEDGDHLVATANLNADQCEQVARDLEEQAAALREAQEEGWTDV